MTCTSRTVDRIDLSTCLSTSNCIVKIITEIAMRTPISWSKLFGHDLVGILVKYIINALTIRLITENLRLLI